MVKPKHSTLPAYKRLLTSRSPLRTDGLQESFFRSARLALMQIGISLGIPGAAHICMPTLRFGCGALDAHKEKQTVAAGSSLGQPPISFWPQICPVIMGVVWEAIKRRKVKKHRDTESPQGFWMIDVTNNPTFCSSSLNTTHHEQKRNI